MSLAEPVADPDEIRQLLVAQVTGVVRWRETVSWLGAHGVTDVWEIGAGKGALWHGAAHRTIHRLSGGVYPRRRGIWRCKILKNSWAEE